MPENLTASNSAPNSQAANAPAPEFLSRSQFAAHVGVSPATVTRWSKAGHVTFTADGLLVDVAATKARLAEAIDPDRSKKARESANRSASKKKNGRPSDPRSEALGVSLTREQSRHRAAMADRAELELRVRVGELCEVAGVRRGIETAFGTVRDSLDALPARLASRVAAEHDVRKCHDMIAAECRAMLADLSTSLETIVSNPPEAH